MIKRGQHWTDTPHPTLKRHRQRIIRNWANFKVPGQDWSPSNPRAEVAQGAPPNWAGSFDFSFSSLEGPMQVFVRDAMDVGNRAMLGVRRSDSPNDWLNMKALDVQASDSVISSDGKTITYPGLWPGCDLVYGLSAHKLKETVVIWDKALAPDHFEWTIKVSPGRTLEIANNIYRLLDGQGVEQIHSRPPWGEDSATTAPSPDGTQYIRCTITEQSPRFGLKVVRLTPNPDDMDSAVGTVRLDPTTVIRGTTDIEDNTTLTDGANKNWGSLGRMFYAGTDKRAIYVRVLASAIPAGTISGFKWVTYYENSTVGSLEVFRLVDANVWVEGTASGEIQTGSSCFNFLQHDTVQWAGGQSGGRTSGTDYTADGSPPALVNPTDGQFNDIILPTVWATDWRDGIRVTNGFVGIFDDPLESVGAAFSSERPGGLDCTFEVDYVGAGYEFFFMGGM